MKTLKNKVYLLTGLMLLSVTVLVWVAFGWGGHTLTSNAQGGQGSVFQTCTNQPEGSFYETWTANELTVITESNAAGNIYAFTRTTNGSNGWGNGIFGATAKDAIAPTQWAVSGRMCR